MPIKMIQRGFAANDITNIVLKFGGNLAKVRGVTGGGKFLEKLRKSNHAKTDGMNCAKTAQRIKMIFGGWAATVNASVVSKYGDNRPKGRGVSG